MAINIKVPDLTELKPRITVFGVGGAGGNAVNNMITSGLEGVEFVVANTDAQALATSKAERRIQMGTNVTEGLGAGSKPEIGAAAAEEAIDEIKAQLAGSHMVFITAGMGGGTGTGAAPVIARAAFEESILTVGVVTKPFQFEGKRRLQTAEDGIKELEKSVDTLLVIPNQNLFRVANEKTTFADAFALADEVLNSGVACITDLMVKEGLINLDFADVSTVMKGMGKAMMGTGEAIGEQRACEAAEAAISNPLLDDVCMKGARGLLISITGGNDLTLYEVDEAASRIREEVDQDANIILGATFDESLDGKIRVSVVATSIETQPSEAAEPVEKVNGSPVQGLATSLAERIQGIQGPESKDEPEAPDPAEEDSDDAVWQGPGDVTIEKMPAAPAQQPQTNGASESGDKASDTAFVPQPPSVVRRSARRIPKVEDLPVVAQKEIAAKNGEAPELGIEAQKKKIGFFERLTSVGRSSTASRPRITRKEEPPMEVEPEVEAELPELKATGTDGPKIAAIEPKKSKAPKTAPPPEPVEDQEELEIPAFLRRQVN
jgi:cell division protein FtsZ